jgi:hypothetical protein
MKEKEDEVLWTGFISLKMLTSGAVVDTVMNLRVP